MKNKFFSIYKLLLLILPALTILPTNAWAVYGNTTGTALELKEDSGQPISSVLLTFYTEEGAEVGQLITNEEGEVCVVGNKSEEKPGCLLLPGDGNYTAKIGDQVVPFSIKDGFPHIGLWSAMSPSGQAAAIIIPLIAVIIGSSDSDSDATSTTSTTSTTNTTSSNTTTTVSSPPTAATVPVHLKTVCNKYNGNFVLQWLIAAQAVGVDPALLIGAVMKMKVGSQSTSGTVGANLQAFLQLSIQSFGVYNWVITSLTLNNGTKAELLSGTKGSVTAGTSGTGNCK